MKTGPVTALLILLLLGGVSPTPATAGASGTVVTSVVPSPLVAELDVRPTTLRTGQSGTVRVTVQNLATDAVREVTARLVVPDGISVIGGEVQEVGDLRGGQRRAVHWRVCAQEPGNHILVAHLEAVVPAVEATVETTSTGRVISVVRGGPPRSTCP